MTTTSNSVTRLVDHLRRAFTELPDRQDRYTFAAGRVELRIDCTRLPAFAQISIHDSQLGILGDTAIHPDEKNTQILEWVCVLASEHAKQSLQK